MILFSIIEMSLFFAASSVIQGATEEASRLIRTGQVQQSNGNPQELFENALCGHARTFASCNDIDYEVITLSNFGDFNNFPPQYDTDGNFVSQGFTPGDVNDVVLIRTTYIYPFIMPFLSSLFGEGEGGTRRIISTLVLQTEPYDLAQEV